MHHTPSFCNCLLLTALALGGMTALPRTLLSEETTPPPQVSAGQLQQWLTELDADEYQVREAAGHRLAQAGPAALEVLGQGVMSDSAEIAWRSGAALEQIAVTGDEQTLSRITKILDQLSEKGKSGLKSLAAEMHVRQKHFRHDRALASLRQNGAKVQGGYDELGGVMIGGGVMMPIAVDAMPILEEGEVIEVEEALPVEKPLAFGALEAISRLLLPGAGGRAIGRAMGGGGEPAEEAIPVDDAAEDAFPADELEAELREAPLAPAPLVPTPPIRAPQIAEPQVAEPQALELAPAVKDAPAIEAPPVEDAPAIEAPAVEEAIETLEPAHEPAVEIVEEVMEVRDIAMEADDAIMIAGPIFGMGGMMMGGEMEEGEAVAPPLDLLLDKNWRGGDDGLKVLADVPEIWQISLQEAQVTDAALEHMAALPNLGSLQIRKTDVTREGLRKLRAAKPTLQIQARGDAMLGVNADIGTSPLVLTSVFFDSGAHQAGMRDGDIITKLDDIAVQDFSDLTIAVYGRQPGDKVKVDFERNGEKQTVIVTLKPRAGE